MRNEQTVMPWFLGFLALGFLAALTMKKASAGSFGGKGGQQVIDTKGYTTQSWGSYLAPLCQENNIPLPFMLFSIEEESGGNPCAIGAPGALGPDGNPRELGIFQLYNPDDLQLLGTSGEAMRAFCVAGKIQVKDRHGNLVWTHRQDVARSLTEDEMKQQASLAVRKVLQAKHQATSAIMTAKASWSNVDFWRVVKLVHGLPGLVHGIVVVANTLGRAPSSWHEYRSLVESGTVKLDSGTEAYRSDFAAIFDNAEQATAGMESVNV